MSGVKPAGLDVPPMPSEFWQPFEHYCDLRISERITWGEIDAYQRLTGAAVDARLVVDISRAISMAHAGRSEADILAAFGLGGG